MQQFKLAAFLFFCLLAFVQNAQAQSVVGTLSVQGNLKKNNGQTVDDGTYSLTFKLYTASAGGTAIWTETQQDVSLVGGVYSVALGTVTPLTPNFDAPYWLGVSIGSGAEMQPRMALTPAPYALAMLGTAPAYFGDVKASAQTADHAGWVLLDGRAKSTLTATQQAQATALGIGANLLNDDGRVVTGPASGQTVGQLAGGSSTITIAQNNLPNIDLTAASAGAHTHTVSYNPNFTYTASSSIPFFDFSTGDYVVRHIDNDGTYTLSFSGTTQSNGAHTHTVSLNGGVTQQPVSLPPPASIALNFFIYLGN
jgi:hypothetical protein